MTFHKKFVDNSILNSFCFEIGRMEDFKQMVTSHENDEYDDP